MYLTFYISAASIHLDDSLNVEKEVPCVSFQTTFKALSDPTRREILSLLKHGAMTAGEIGAKFEITGASISHHLAVLRDSGLITDDRRGKYIYYELNMTVLDELLGWAADLRGEKL